MNNTVIIKSFQNGLSVYLDAELPFSQLLDEIAAKFKEAGKFFQDAKLALSLEGRELTEKEERLVLDTICQYSGLNIICIIGKDEEKNQSFLHALQQLEQSNPSNDGQFYKGNLKNGQILETESTIIMLGDVYPESSIISSKDIIILGGLYGEAYAGANGDGEHFVVALEMAPSRLKIGDCRYKGTEKTSRWSIKPKVQPKIAYTKDNQVVIEPITKELLNDIPF